MASYLELSEQEKTAIRRAEKCFRLAARAGTPEEAATANAMGQEIMLAYNLNMAMLEEHGGDTGKRKEEKLKGGHYEYQRDLWEAVAELNFCMYFNIEEKAYDFKWEKIKNGVGFKKIKKLKFVRTHRLVGRVVNVQASQVMAEYLEQTVERLTKERCDLGKIHLYSKWAMDYREGIVSTVREKIAERRRHMVDEERRKAEEVAARAAAGYDGEVSLSKAVTIQSVIDKEHEANLDFLNPNRHVEAAEAERRRVKFAQDRAEEQRRANERYTKWAAEHPLEAKLEQEAAKKRKEEARKREERNERRRTGPRQSYGSRGDRNFNHDAYAEGRARGREVSIDRQAGNEKHKQIRG